MISLTFNLISYRFSLKIYSVHVQLSPQLIIISDISLLWRAQLIGSCVTMNRLFQSMIFSPLEPQKFRNNLYGDPRSESVVPAEKSMVDDGSTPGILPRRRILFGVLQELSFSVEECAPRSESVDPPEKSMVAFGSTPGMLPRRRILGAASPTDTGNGIVTLK